MYALWCEVNEQQRQNVGLYRLLHKLTYRTREFYGYWVWTESITWIQSLHRKSEKLLSSRQVIRMGQTKLFHLHSNTLHILRDKLWHRPGAIIMWTKLAVLYVVIMFFFKGRIRCVLTTAMVCGRYVFSNNSLTLLDFSSTINVSVYHIFRS